MYKLTKFGTITEDSNGNLVFDKFGFDFQGNPLSKDAMMTAVMECLEKHRDEGEIHVESAVYRSN